MKLMILQVKQEEPKINLLNHSVASIAGKSIHQIGGSDNLQF